jgi:hypothetical protein
MCVYLRRSVRAQGPERALRASKLSDGGRPGRVGETIAVTGKHRARSPARRASTNPIERNSRAFLWTSDQQEDPLNLSI